MKKTTTNILFIVGLLLIIIQVFILDHMLQNGTLVVPQSSNLATFIYDVFYWIGLCPLGIIGLVMTIIGAVYMNKSEKQ